MAKEMSQAERRRPITMTDQHGRTFESTLDITSMGTCAPINPKGWTAPVIPPQKYIRHQGGSDVLKVLIDYDKWESDLRQAHEDYASLVQTWAQSVSPDQALNLIENPTPSFLRLVGPSPMPVEIVIACRQENGWILGKRQEPTTKADRTLYEMLKKLEPQLPDFSDPSEEDFTDEPVEAPRLAQKRTRQASVEVA